MKNDIDWTFIAQNLEDALAEHDDAATLQALAEARQLWEASNVLGKKMAAPAGPFPQEKLEMAVAEIDALQESLSELPEEQQAVCIVQWQLARHLGKKMRFTPSPAELDAAMKSMHTEVHGSETAKLTEADEQLLASIGEIAAKKPRIEVNLDAAMAKMSARIAPAQETNNDTELTPADEHLLNNIGRLAADYRATQAAPDIEKAIAEMNAAIIAEEQPETLKLPAEDAHLLASIGKVAQAYQQRLPKPDLEAAISAMQAKLPAEAPASFTVSKGAETKQVATKSRSLGNWKWYMAAAASLVIGFFLFDRLPEMGLTNEQPTLATTDLEVRTLPDGSQVWLTAGSQLVLDEQFNVSERRALLTGTAFFNIARNKDKPFYVLSGPTVTKVLGTSFQIEASENKDIKLSVVSGKVGFSSEASNKIALEVLPDNTVTYSAAQRSMEMDEAPTAHLAAIMRQRLEFKDAKLIDVVKVLKLAYEADMLLAEGDYTEQKFTGTFEDKSLEEVLDTLALVLNIKWELSDEEVYFLTDNK